MYIWYTSEKNTAQRHVGARGKSELDKAREAFRREMYIWYTSEKNTAQRHAGARGKSELDKAREAFRREMYIWYTSEKNAAQRRITKFIHRAVEKKTVENNPQPCILNSFY